MERDKKFWIKIAIAGVLIVTVITTAVIMILSIKKEERYNEQMKIAKAAYKDMDYESMIEAYEKAIELMPEDPDAYLKLAEYYLETGDLEEAEEIADKGYKRSGSRRMRGMLDDIEAEIDWLMTYDAELTWTGEEDDEVVVRNNMVIEIAEFCYQQYINTYGDSNVKNASEGVCVNFRGLDVKAYFKNTAENKNAIDAITKKPVKNAKPYKVVLEKPSLVFVNYEGYIAYETLTKLFKSPGTMSTVGDQNILTFEYMECKINIPVDSKGNMSGSDVKIEIQPMNLISYWEEVVVEEDEEDVDTFELGGEIYTYDITSIYIYGKTLDDLSPLEECKDLKTISFISCDINDLSPISGCDSLESLDLGFSEGDLDLSCLSDLDNLKYLGFHGCKDIDDLSPIMKLELLVLHPCESGVSKKQCIEYQERHPNCEVWFDYYYPIPE